MTEKRFAAMMAGQTALIWTICELLIEKNLIGKIQLRDALYDLLHDNSLMNANPDSQAPIRHLISVMEAMDLEN